MPRDLEGFTTATDGHEIPYRAWLAEDPGAVLLIAHGMAEHAGRYQPFGEYLAAHGISTWAVEHRGHGAHCPAPDRGHFADREGWRKVVSDLNPLKRHVRGISPQLPLVLLGHSMGSYVALAAVTAEAQGYNGLLLTGSGLNPRWLLATGIAVCRLERLRAGGRGTSSLMNTLTFRGFNRTFAPNRTPFDWLSRDTRQVDRYLADPLCGFTCTNQFWLDLLHGQRGLFSSGDGAGIPADFPVRLISGSRDPVGRFGTGVVELASRLRRSGTNAVDVTLIPDARHEVINETNQREIWATIQSWIAGVAASGRSGTA